MKGTKPAGETQYGAANTLYPGRRNKAANFDTSVGATATTVALNATVNACANAQDAILKASRVVTSTAVGLASRTES